MGSRFPRPLKKLGLSNQRNRDFQRISECKKGKSSKSLLYLRSFLCRNADSLEEALTHYLICPDICNRHQLR